MATRSTRRGALAAAAGMLLLAFGSAGAQTTISADSIRGILQQRIERGGAVGIVAGRITDGRTEVVAAGTSAAGAQPVDASTVFEIGSISKVFTTMLLADMVVRGEVSLEDPVSKYLPDSVRVPSRNGREITLLHLATASSGLPRLPTNMAPDDITNPYADYGVDELYAFLGSYTLPRDPGASYEYSNLGMGLLGHLLSLEAGKPYEALVIERILEPLAMTETRITPTPAMRERIAQGHSADLEPVANWTFDVIAPAGGWFSPSPTCCVSRRRRWTRPLRSPVHSRWPWSRAWRRALRTCASGWAGTYSSRTAPPSPGTTVRPEATTASSASTRSAVPAPSCWRTPRPTSTTSGCTS